MSSPEEIVRSRQNAVHEEWRDKNKERSFSLATEMASNFIPRFVELMQELNYPDGLSAPYVFVEYNGEARVGWELFTSMGGGDCLGFRINILANGELVEEKRGLHVIPFELFDENNLKKGELDQNHENLGNLVRGLERKKLEQES